MHPPSLSPKPPVHGPFIRTAAPERQFEEAEYASWWRTPEEPRFTGSSVQRDMAQSARALDGVETYAFSALRLGFGDGYPSASRVSLPRYMKEFAVRHEGRRLLFTAAAGRGLQLHFPRATTAVEQRAAAWSALAAWSEEVRAKVEASGGPMDEPERRKYGPWLAKVLPKLATLEEKDPIDSLFSWFMGRGVRGFFLDATVVADDKRVPVFYYGGDPAGFDTWRKRTQDSLRFAPGWGIANEGRWEMMEGA